MAVRRLGSLAFAMSAVGTLVLTQGCADDGVSLHVICPIPPTVEDGSCLYESAGDVCLTSGVLNVAASQFYTVYLRAESGLTARARSIPPQGEPNGLSIQTASVELRLPGGQVIDFCEGVTPCTLPNPFTVPATGFITPGGLAPVPVDVITPGYAAYLTERLAGVPQVVAAITLKGQTSGKVTVESDEFVWPIRLASASTKSAGRACTPDVDFCRSGLGQDSFAFVCDDSP